MQKTNPNANQDKRKPRRDSARHGDIENERLDAHPEEQNRLAYKDSDSASHMGAQEKDTTQRKPPTQELAEMTNPDGQAVDPQDDDYNPGDEITPG